MKNRQLYGQEFASKKALLKWIEENYDKIDWNYSVYLEWYYKEEDNKEDENGEQFTLPV